MVSVLSRRSFLRGAAATVSLAGAPGLLTQSCGTLATKGEAVARVTRGGKWDDESYAVGDAVDFENAIGIENIEKRDLYLASLLKEELKNIQGITLLSAMEDRLSSPLTSILVQKRNGSPLPIDGVYKTFFDKYRIRVRLVGEHGINAIRISTHIYNNPSCVQKVCAAIEDITSRGVEGV